MQTKHKFVIWSCIRIKVRFPVNKSSLTLSLPDFRRHLSSVFMPQHRMMAGAYSFLVFHTWVRAYECTSFCTNLCTYLRMYVILLDSG